MNKMDPWSLKDSRPVQHEYITEDYILFGFYYVCRNWLHILFIGLLIRIMMHITL